MRENELDQEPPPKGLRDKTTSQWGISPREPKESRLEMESPIEGEFGINASRGKSGPRG